MSVAPPLERSGRNAPPGVVALRGVALSTRTERQCIDHVLDELDAGRGGWLVTVNLDVLRLLATQEPLRELTLDATMFVADGMPLIWASRLRGTPLPERIAGSTLMVTLSEAAAKRGRSVYLLGGNEGAAEGAASALRERFPSIRIAGFHCPPFGFEKDEARMRAMREALGAAKPDIVYVALGCPKQERLIQALRPVLPGAWFTGVGISFSFLSGEVRRAPVWMQRIGFEWLHRMAQEPRRLVKRYLIDDLPFAASLFAGALAERLGGRSNESSAMGGGA